MYNRHDRPKQRPYVGLRYGYHAGCVRLANLHLVVTPISIAMVSFQFNETNAPDLHVFFEKVFGVSIMINGFSVYVVVDYHEKIFSTLSNDTLDVVFWHLVLQVCGNCRGRSKS